MIFIPRFMTETQLVKPKEGKMPRTTIVLKLGLAIALALAFGARIASADQAVYDLFTGNGGGLGSFTGPYAVASPVGTRDVSKNDTTIGGTGKAFAFGRSNAHSAVAAILKRRSRSQSPTTSASTKLGDPLVNVLVLSKPMVNRRNMRSKAEASRTNSPAGAPQMAVVTTVATHFIQARSLRPEPVPSLTAPSPRA